ncbi:hypothetical protein CAL7102_06021 [Dulcicalothrix desertica PCC 7102]|nr:hypothetical protein CAL7102_06021 [Dulcicalothrix desertica PCC 7102]
MFGNSYLCSSGQKYDAHQGGASNEWKKHKLYGADNVQAV